jgi:aminopeptidase N
MANDSDDFNRWDAGQQLAIKIIKQLVEDLQQHRPLYLPEPFINAYRAILEDNDLDKSLAAQAISLPSESYIAEFVSPIDPVAIHRVCRFMRETLAAALKDLLMHVYQDNMIRGEYSVVQGHVKKRALKNTCLGYLMETGDSAVQEMCYLQFSEGNNMTDVMAALVALANNDCPQRELALNVFYEKWRNELLVVDKWLSIQATSRLPGTLERIKQLTSHEAFTLKNPNKIRALIGAFGHGNPAQFHDLGGEGYRFITDKILAIDKLNPQIAARLATVYTLWKKYDEERQQLMKQQLDSIIAEPGLSKDVYEIASKSLG